MFDIYHSIFRYKSQFHQQTSFPAPNRPFLRYNTAMKSLGIIRSIRSAITRLSRERHPYEPLITVEISRSAILHNLAEFSRFINPDSVSVKKSIVPVLKSNAYGHGIIPVATILEESNRVSQTKVPFFVIDTYFEAISLHHHGITTPLLIIGYTPPQTIVENRLNNVAFVMTSIDALRELVDLKKNSAGNRYAKNHTSIHIKIDTGMHRQGILPEEIDEALALIKNGGHANNAGITLEGICSHFASSDGTSTEHIAFTRGQVTLWKSLVEKVRAAIPTLLWWHVSNTGGHAYEKDIDSNLARLGIGLYGISQKAPIDKDTHIHLQPALSMKTIVTDIKKIRQGESVGYSNTFIAPQDMTIATIPLGYFEGIDRSLSSKGSVEVAGILCPIVGRVSMNITTFDATALIKDTAGPGIRRGDIVTVISDDSTKSNSIEQMARLAETIVHTIAIHIPGHLKRVIVD